MKIQKTYERRTKNNHYKKYFIEDYENDFYYYASFNFDNILYIRKRIKASKDDSKEFFIDKSELPAIILTSLTDEL